MQYNTEHLRDIHNRLNKALSSAQSIYSHFIILGNTEDKTEDNVNYFGQTNYFENDRSNLFELYLDFAKKENCKNIYSLIPTECHSPLFQQFIINHFNEKGNTKPFCEFDEKLDELDCNLYYVYGSYNPEMYKQFESEINLKRIKILYWPTYLITHTFDLYYTGFIQNGKHESLDLNQEFEKLYINYNNRPRIHRKIMMDLLCKRNLLEQGFNSWNEISNQNNGTDIVTSYTYNTECWHEQIMNLDDYKSKDKDYLEEHSPTMLRPNALFSLVGETSMDVPYVTEKTYRCFFFKQPFIAYGAKGQNKEILNYGFKLFDNIIDYSFDDEPVHTKRFELLLNQLEKFKNENFNDIYKKVEPILEHNRKRVYELLLKDEFIPKELLEIYENRN